jgi:hypothetical protein
MWPAFFSTTNLLLLAARFPARSSGQVAWKTHFEQVTPDRALKVDANSAEVAQFQENQATGAGSIRF